MRQHYVDRFRRRRRDLGVYLGPGDSAARAAIGGDSDRKRARDSADRARVSPNWNSWTALTSSAFATLPSQRSVGDVVPFTTFQKCDRATPARSGRCVIAIFCFSASARIAATTLRCSSSNSASVGSRCVP